MDVNDNVKMAFAASFPLPFRVLCLIGMGILGWATNLHGMALFGVDAVSALDIRSHDEHSSRLLTHSPRQGVGFKVIDVSYQKYTPIYRLLWSYSLWSLLAWIIFRFTTYGRLELVDACRYIAALCGLGVIGALVCPFEVFEKPERDMFLR